MDKKLPDDEVVKQFCDRSLRQKLKCVLRQSHQSFIHLVEAWIQQEMSGEVTGKEGEVA